MYIYIESPPISPNVSAADVSLPESPQSTYIFQPPTSITPTPTHGDSDPIVDRSNISLPKYPQSTNIFQPPTSIPPTPTHGDSDPIVDRSNLKLARSGLIFKQDALGRSVDEASRIRENKKNLNLALRRGQVVDHSK